MSPNFREELDLLFPLADAIQMRLDVRGKLGGSKVTGEAEFWMDLGPVKVLLRPRVMAAVVARKEASAGLLVKVQKRLWCYLAYFKGSDVLQIAILDANLVGLKESNCTSYSLMDPDSAFTKLQPGIVGHYIRERKSTIWIPVSHADPVDEGRGESPQEESRATGTPV